MKTPLFEISESELKAKNELDTFLKKIKEAEAIVMALADVRKQRTDGKQLEVFERVQERARAWRQANHPKVKRGNS